MFLNRLRSIKISVPTVNSIWRRRSKSTANGIRNRFIYKCFRTAKPQREWITDLGFDFSWVKGESPRLSHVPLECLRGSAVKIGSISAGWGGPV